MTMFGKYSLACALALGSMALGQSAAAQGNAPAAAQTAAAQDANGLVIEPEELPVTYPHGIFQVNFHARGNYVPVLHWRVESGTLPPGIKLEDNGELHGEAERAGEFHFVVSVRDGGQPQQALQRGYTIKVVDSGACYGQPHRWQH
jgi:hypothetical protein